MKTFDFLIHTDGGARGNPGPAGIGYTILDAGGEILREKSQYIGQATNNVAEYTAVVEALNTLKKLIPANKRKNAQIEVRMDSELVVKQLNGEYQIREETLQGLFVLVWNLRVVFPHISFRHIPRSENVRADELANEAMDRGA